MWKRNFKFGYAFGAVYLAAFALAAVCYWREWQWWAVALVIHFVIFSFGFSFGLHKSAAHQMAPADHPLVRLALLTGVLANIGSPIEFILTHRMHHRFADGDADPQNAQRLGWKLFFGARSDAGAAEPMIELYENREVLRMPFYQWVHNYYYLILAAYFILAFSLGGVRGLLFLALIPGGLSFFALGALNYFGHSRAGYRNFYDHAAKNVVWLFPWLLGEAWHNNHHADPSARNYRKRFWEFDPSAVYFLLVSRQKPK